MKPGGNGWDEVSLIGNGFLLGFSFYWTSAADDGVGPESFPVCYDLVTGR